MRTSSISSFTTAGISGKYSVTICFCPRNNTIAYSARFYNNRWFYRQLTFFVSLQRKTIHIQNLMRIFICQCNEYRIFCTGLFYSFLRSFEYPILNSISWNIFKLYFRCYGCFVSLTRVKSPCSYHL